jgi:hypothetical protein
VPAVATTAMAVNDQLHDPLSVAPSAQGSAHSFRCLADIRLRIFGDHRFRRFRVVSVCDSSPSDSVSITNGRGDVAAVSSGRVARGSVTSSFVLGTFCAAEVSAAGAATEVDAGVGSRNESRCGLAASTEAGATSKAGTGNGTAAGAGMEGGGAIRAGVGFGEAMSAGAEGTK